MRRCNEPVKPVAEISTETWDLAAERVKVEASEAQTELGWAERELLRQFRRVEKPTTCGLESIWRNSDNYQKISQKMYNRTVTVLVEEAIMPGILENILEGKENRRSVYELLKQSKIDQSFATKIGRYLTTHKDELDIVRVRDEEHYAFFHPGVRELTYALREPYGRRQSIAELNRKLKPNNLVLDADSLATLLEVADQKDKIEYVTNILIRVFKSNEVEPLNSFSRIHLREDDEGRIPDFVAYLMGKTMAYIFNSSECRKLRYYQGYCNLFEALDRKHPTRKEITASPLTPSYSTYDHYFGGVRKMLEVCGDPAEQSTASK